MTENRKRLFGRRKEDRERFEIEDAADTVLERPAPSAPMGLSQVQRAALLFAQLSEADQLEFLSGLSRTLLERSLGERDLPTSPVALPDRRVARADQFDGPDRRAGGGERRSEPRAPVDAVARVVFENQRSTIDCKMIDLSTNGCRLLLDNPLTLPNFFVLEMQETGEKRAAHTVWRRAREAGVKFRY